MHLEAVIIIDGGLAAAALPVVNEIEPHIFHRAMMLAILPRRLPIMVVTMMIESMAMLVIAEVL